eukprot:11432263-Ditylum_brightwellii.AAC.1
MYAGIFCNDGLIIFQDQRSINQTISWLCNFQLQVDKVVGGKFFQFTAELWKPLEVINIPTMEKEEELEGMLPNEYAKWAEKVTVVTKEEFPYLDMKISWKDDNLQFVVYIKEN